MPPFPLPSCLVVACVWDGKKTFQKVLPGWKLRPCRPTGKSFPLRSGCRCCSRLGGCGLWGPRKSRHVTTGASIMGLRPHRGPDESRAVRTRDIPGLSRGVQARIVSVAGALLVLLVLAFFAHTLFLQREGLAMRERNIATSMLRNTPRPRPRSSATSIRQSQPGRSRSTMISRVLSPRRSDAARELVARHAKGDVDSYAIESVGTVEAFRTPCHGKTTPWPYETALLVRANEYAEGSDAPVQYEYRVVYTLGSQGDAAEWNGCWRIESAEPVAYAY